MALGNPISVGDDSARVVSVIATASQTLFNVTGGYKINQIGVYRNGVRLVDGRDYLARDGASVTLLNDATNGDVLEFQIFDDFRVPDAIVSAESDQTIFGNLTIEGNLNVAGISTAGSIGIQSGDVAIGVAKTLNFIGFGNTFQDSGDGTIDISIRGGGSGGLGTGINYSDGSRSPFSYIPKYEAVTEDLYIDSTNAGTTTSYVVTAIPNIEIAAGVAVTVDTDKTMVIDILLIGDL